MEEGWCLPNPDLIISVTGGGQQFHMSPHLRQAFQYGLVVAAAKTSKTNSRQNISKIMSKRKCNHYLIYCFP